MSPVRDTSRSATRPLTARSVIASTLLGVDPPRLPALALVRSGELFGLSAGATRTALSRMASAGEVESDGGSYALAGRLLERHRRQQDARAPGVRPWDGSWEVSVVTVQRRSAADRAELREAARRLRLAEVRDGCWARPDNLPPDRDPGARAVVDAQCTTLRHARPDGAAALLDAFDLGSWANTARDLVEEMRAAQAGLDARDTDVLGPTFVIDAAVVRHLMADPVLPPALHPEDWPADELRAAFARFDDGFKQTWRDWYRAFRDR